MASNQFMKLGVTSTEVLPFQIEESIYYQDTKFGSRIMARITFTDLDQKEDLEFIKYFKKQKTKGQSFYNSLLKHFFKCETTTVELTIFTSQALNTIMERLVFEHVFGFIDPLTALQLALTCKDFYGMIFTERRFHTPSFVLYSIRMQYRNTFEDYSYEDSEDHDGGHSMENERERKQRKIE